MTHKYYLLTLDFILTSLGYKISDFGELKVPLTDSENHNYIASDTFVKNSLECGLVAQKVSYRMIEFK